MADQRKVRAGIAYEIARMDLRAKAREFAAVPAIALNSEQLGVQLEQHAIMFTERLADMRRLEEGPNETE